MDTTQNTFKFFAFLLGIHLLATGYAAVRGAPFHLLSAIASCALLSVVGAVAFWCGQRRTEFKHSSKSLVFCAALCWAFFQSSSGLLGVFAGVISLAVMAGVLGWRGGALVKSNRAQPGIQPDGPASGGSAG